MYESAFETDSLGLIKHCLINGLELTHHSDRLESNGAPHRETAQAAAITIDTSVQAIDEASPNTSSLDPSELATPVDSAVFPSHRLDGVRAVPYSDGLQKTTVAIQVQPINHTEVAIQVNAQVSTSDISIQVEEPPKVSTSVATAEYANAVIQTNPAPVHAEVAIQVEELLQLSTSTKLEVAIDTSELPNVVVQYAESVVQTDAPVVEQLEESSGDVIETTNRMDDNEDNLYGPLPSTHDMADGNAISITDAGVASDVPRYDGPPLSHGVETDAEMASHGPLPATSDDNTGGAWLVERQEMQSRIDALAGENARLTTEMQTTFCTTCYAFLPFVTGSQPDPISAFQVLDGSSGTVAGENDPSAFGQGMAPGVNQDMVFTNTMIDGSQSAYYGSSSGDHQGIFYQGVLDAMAMFGSGSHSTFGPDTAQNVGYTDVVHGYGLDPNSQVSSSNAYGSQVVLPSYNEMPNFGITSTPTQLYDQQLQHTGQIPNAGQETHQYVVSNSATIPEPTVESMPDMGFEIAMPYTSTPVIATNSTSVDTVTQVQPEIEHSLQETANVVMAMLLLSSSSESTDVAIDEAPPVSTTNGETREESQSTIPDRVFARLPKRALNRNNGSTQSQAPEVHFDPASSSLAEALGGISNTKVVATNEVPPLSTTNGEKHAGSQSTITDRVFARLPRRALSNGSAQSQAPAVHFNPASSSLSGAIGDISSTSNAVLPQAGPSSVVEQVDPDTMESTSDDDNEDRVSLCASENDDLEEVYIPRFEGLIEGAVDESSNNAPEPGTRETSQMDDMAPGHMDQSSDGDLEYRDELYWEMEAQAALELEAERAREERLEQEWEENGM